MDAKLLTMLEAQMEINKTLAARVADLEAQKKRGLEKRKKEKEGGGDAAPKKQKKDSDKPKKKDSDKPKKKPHCSVCAQLLQGADHTSCKAEKKKAKAAKEAKKAAAAAGK